MITVVGFLARASGLAAQPHTRIKDQRGILKHAADRFHGPE
ncbi:MAG: hypothetical protein ACXVII_22520 [Solirubrobacteraceae bacterium]